MMIEQMTLAPEAAEESVSARIASLLCVVGTLEEERGSGGTSRSRCSLLLRELRRDVHSANPLVFLCARFQ